MSDEPFFSVIIPTYNNEDTIERAVKSIQAQDFKDYELIIVDDVSTDKTGDILYEIDAQQMFLPMKHWNGGTRNVGVEMAMGEYILFLDADDEFISPDFFGKLHEFIVEGKFYPDMVRLPYVRHYETGRETVIDRKRFNEKTIADVAHSPRVAAWTKAVKASLFQPFPENTLMEDVCQHLKQVDVIHSVGWFPEPAVRWYLHSKSTSRNNSPKWQSSAWRFVADLMDLELTKEYTKARRDEKVRAAKDNLKHGIIQQ